MINHVDKHSLAIKSGKRVVGLIQFIHWAVLAFVLTAWFWPASVAVWVHVVFVPLMVIHWRTNQNRCFLSELEERFKTDGDVVTVEAEESQFIKMAWLKLFGRVPSDQALEVVIYVVLAVVWIISVGRLMVAARTS